MWQSHALANLAATRKPTCSTGKIAYFHRSEVIAYIVTFRAVNESSGGPLPSNRYPIPSQNVYNALITLLRLPSSNSEPEAELIRSPKLRNSISSIENESSTTPQPARKAQLSLIASHTRGRKPVPDGIPPKKDDINLGYPQKNEDEARRAKKKLMAGAQRKKKEKGS
ncbi:hypothetical protein EVAR_37426_1 [Eumeta japonica]|uniref:Uncharacterized protein n=1 Tax=Eumeta variegata TaxID=151549 RepID=A0A4C1WHP4_EUMVA|nr:hypothetical protein EVAR_37426_1 [Eumeta japonica]